MHQTNTYLYDEFPRDVYFQINRAKKYLTNAWQKKYLTKYLQTEFVIFNP